MTPKFDNRQGQVNIRAQGNGLVMTAVKNGISLSRIYKTTQKGEEKVIDDLY